MPTHGQIMLSFLNYVKLYDNMILSYVKVEKAARISSNLSKGVFWANMRCDAMSPPHDGDR